MKRQFFSTLIVLSFLVGCASTPPHRIINQRYINPEHQISIKVPEGWLKTDKIPYAYRKNTVWNPQIMFYNPDTNGTIICSFVRTFLNLSELPRAHKKMQSSDKKNLANWESELKKKPSTKSVYYRYYPTERLSNYPTMTIEREWSQVLFEGMKATNYDLQFMYTCNIDDTCLMLIELVSPSNTYRQNRIVYKEIIDSISRDFKQYDNKTLPINNDLTDPLTQINEGWTNEFKQTKETSETNDIEARLKKLKSLLDKGLITEEDYQKKKAELLEQF